MTTEEENGLIRSLDISERVIGIRQFVKRQRNRMPDRIQTTTYVPTDVYCEMLTYWIANGKVEDHFDIEPLDTTSDKRLEHLFLFARESMAGTLSPLSFVNLKDDIVEMLLVMGRHERCYRFITGVCMNLRECKNLSRRIHLLLVHCSGHNSELKLKFGRWHRQSDLGKYDKKLLSGEETMSLAKYAYYMNRRLTILNVVSLIRKQIADYQFIIRNNRA